MELALRRVAPVRSILVALLMAFSLFAGSISPVNAETVGQRNTRNIILGALAMTAGIILYNNYQHKVYAARTIVGYTRDGGTVYADGRIVYPDGTTIYTSNNGRTICTFNGYGQQCQPNNIYGYYPQGRYYTTNCVAVNGAGFTPPGWAKHHRCFRRGNDQGEDFDNDGD